MKSRKARSKLLSSFLFILLLFIGFGGSAVGKAPAGNIAIKGFDPVAYFNEGKAIKGHEAITFQWHDPTWYFLSKNNKDLFVSGPEKYAPQYDGFCAWAMSERRKAQSDPEVWERAGGRLYLNCSSTAYEKWSRDIPGNIKKADSYWLKYSGRN